MISVYKFALLAVLVSMFAVVQANDWSPNCGVCYDDSLTCPLVEAKFEVGDRVVKLRPPSVRDAVVRSVVVVGGEFYYDVSQTTDEWFIPEALLRRE